MILGNVGIAFSLRLDTTCAQGQGHDPEGNAVPLRHGRGGGQEAEEEQGEGILPDGGGGEDRPRPP